MASRSSKYGRPPDTTRLEAIGKIELLPVDGIHQNPYQPRRTFEPGALGYLAESIRQFGVLVPIVVTPCEGGYQLACGERRLRACRQIGLKTIPAVVRRLSTPEILELAFVENLHRQDLSPVEEMETFDRLRQEFGHLSEEELCRRIGTSPEKLERYRKLRGLCLLIRRAVVSDLISVVQAEALSRLPGEGLQVATLKRICEHRLDEASTLELVEEILQTMTGGPQA